MMDPFSFPKQVSRSKVRVLPLPLSPMQLVVRCGMSKFKIEHLGSC